MNKRMVSALVASAAVSGLSMPVAHAAGEHTQGYVEVTNDGQTTSLTATMNNRFNTTPSVGQSYVLVSAMAGGSYISIFGMTDRYKIFSCVVRRSNAIYEDVAKFMGTLTNGSFIYAEKVVSTDECGIVQFAVNSSFID